MRLPWLVRQVSREFRNSLSTVVVPFLFVSFFIKVSKLPWMTFSLLNVFQRKSKSEMYSLNVIYLIRATDALSVELGFFVQS